MPWGCVLVPGAGHGDGEDLLLVQNQYQSWEGDDKSTGGGGGGKLTAFTSGAEAGAMLVGNHAGTDNFMCIAVASCDGDSEVVMKPQLYKEPAVAAASWGCTTTRH